MTAETTDGLIVAPRIDAFDVPGLRRPPHTATPGAIAAAIGLGAIALGAVWLLPPLYAGAVLLGVGVLYLARRLVFSWTGGLMAFAAIVMFVPIRRYALPIPLPFQLEPYRLVMVILLVSVVLALAFNKSFTWRPIMFGWAIGAYVVLSIMTIGVNAVGMTEQGLGGDSSGGLINFLLLASVLVITRQLLRTERVVFLLLTFLTWAGAVVGFFAVIEKFSGYNVFLQLNKFLPLDMLGDPSETFRAGGARAFGSAQHPIALSVMLCMLIPVALYLARYASRPLNEVSRRIVYSVLILFLLGGVAAAISRTAIVVLGVMWLITMVFRPRLGGILLAIAVPLLAVGGLIMPKIVSATIGSFLDPSALIASQKTSAGMTGAGRLADLTPAFHQVSQYPIFGTGYGTRIVIGPDANSFILDDQVLGTLMESGIVGVLGLAIFMLVPPIMLLRFAFTTGADARYAQLAFTIAVSAAGYVAALFFYDAFGFLQPLILLFMLLAVGAWAMTDAPAARTRRVAHATPASNTRAETHAVPETVDA